jgi:hypothetical protein
MGSKGNEAVVHSPSPSRTLAPTVHATSAATHTANFAIANSISELNFKHMQLLVVSAVYTLNLELLRMCQQLVSWSCWPREANVGQMSQTKNSLFLWNVAA